MTIYSSGYQAPGGWSFNDIPKSPADDTTRHRHQSDSGTAKSNDGSAQTSSEPRQPQAEEHTPSQEQEQRSWKPRTCRICLETVHPTFPSLSENLPSMLQGTPTPVYISEDCGRLVRPCKCKGSQRYVHEGCLQEWRFADPLSKRNYWQCPTCGFQYRLTRMTWARWISSRAMQVTLTVLVFMLAIFILGFVADPIINAYVDPVGIVAGDAGSQRVRHVRNGEVVEMFVNENESDNTWSEHFVKGFGALGVLGFVKMFFTMGPLNWFNVRGGVFNGGTGRPGTTGRDRVNNISWMVLVLGALTFLYTVWKGVRVLSKRVLEKASEHVLDVPLGPGEIEQDD